MDRLLNLNVALLISLVSATGSSLVGSSESTPQTPIDDYEQTIHVVILYLLVSLTFLALLRSIFSYNIFGWITDFINYLINMDAVAAIKLFIYNSWCFICLYALGATYIPVEINRKIDLFKTVRFLDLHKDLPSSAVKSKTAIITGGSRGIGWEAAKILVSRGVRVIIATSVKEGSPIQALNKRLSRELLDEYKDSLKIDDVHLKLEFWHLDLTSMSSVISFTNRVKESKLHVHVLINNAGQMYAPFRLTADGFESHWAINYLAHSLLILLLLPVLEKSSKSSNTRSRIVNVSSSTHFARNVNLDDVNGTKLYSPFHAYSQSKLAQVMFTYKLNRWLCQRRLIDSITVNCLHPGVAKTELYEHVWWVKTFPFLADIMFRTAKQGSETVLYAAFSPELEGVSGKYLEDCAIMKSSGHSYDQVLQDKLWTQTLESLSKWLPDDVDYSVE